MANYLYFVGGADSLPQNAVTGAYTFSYLDKNGGNVIQPGNLTVQTGTGNPQDGAPTGTIVSQNDPSYNGLNWTLDWGNNASMRDFFVIGCVDADAATTIEVPLAIGGCYDVNNTLQDLVAHNASFTVEKFTVIVPGNINKFGSSRDGTVLVWYIPFGALGAGANAIGLPMRPQLYPVAGDNDTQAAEKILSYGFGLLGDPNTGNPHEAAYWTP